MAIAALMPAASANAAGNLTQQGPKIVPPPLLSGEFGTAVAISANGDTALVGAPGYDKGSGVVGVYVRSGGTWALQERLVVPGIHPGTELGRSVALSADGNTALLGEPGFEEGVGAACLFRRSGTTWQQVGYELVDPASARKGIKGRAGTSVALSADGTEGAVGEPVANTAFVVKTTAPHFAEGHTQERKFEGAHEQACMCGNGFGTSIALSGDGDTLMIGSSPIVPEEEFAREQGAETVYVRSGSKWTKQAGPIVPRGGATALDGDGNTALAAKREWGASVLERSGTSWSVGPQLEPNDANLGCGCRHAVLPSLSLSADGQSALIGYRYDHEFVGAAWLFSRSGSKWAQQGTKLVGGEMSGEAEFGWGSALSADGGTAVIGGPDDGEGGAVWFFTRPATPLAPVVASVSPNKGPAAGGTSVTIEGGYLTAATAVHFGTATASFTVESGTRITAQSPPGTPGKVDVTVTTPGGTSAVTKADRFTYKAH
ncbi:MAG TPA: IPT/TIG domain-containing protein [Solirubrobacteraceae bacterium]|nr:IPT/TIG domain-containing protein [Solirubrobacteraceae bacterium]